MLKTLLSRLKQWIDTIKPILNIWLPSAACQGILSLELALAIACIGHANFSKESLLSLNFILSILFILLIPSQALSTTVAALCQSKRHLNRLIYLGLTCNLIILISAAALLYSPLCNSLFHTIAGLNSQLITFAIQGLLAFLPLLISVCCRRLFLGTLIILRKTKFLVLACGIRLCTTLCTLAILIYFTSYPGVLIAAISISVGACIEAIALYLYVRRLSTWLSAASDTTSFTLWKVLKFYGSLISTGIAGALSASLMTLALPRTSLAEISLLVWPSFRSLTAVIASPVAEMEAITASFSNSREDIKRCRIFAYCLSAVSCLVMGILCFTPLGKWYFYNFNGLSLEASNLALQALTINFISAIFYPIRVWQCGTFLARKDPWIPQKCLWINQSVQFSIMYIGILTCHAQHTLPGLIWAITAQSMGLITENIIFFMYRPRHQIQMHTQSKEKLFFRPHSNSKHVAFGMMQNRTSG